MEFKKLLILTSVLALLGNGCAKISNQTAEINDPGTDFATGTEDYTITANRDPYGKAERAYNRVAENVKPSGQLNPTQKKYTMADRLSWYQKLNWPKDCEADFRLTVDSDDNGIGIKGGLNFYNIADKQYLVHISCATGGNTGEGMLFYLVTVDGQNISGKILQNQKYNFNTKTVEISNENNGVFWGNHDFDPTNKILSIYQNYGYIGNCGSHTEYKIVNDELEIIKFAERSCEEVEAWALKHPNGSTEEPSPYPVIYEKK